MDSNFTRSLIGYLAEDLSWLEGYCRQRPELAPESGRLRLAAALVRNCIGPFLDEQPPTPLHLAVVGGAGTGKSTVVNLLSGSALAEANPQAGFTRHPVAYTSLNGPLRWPAHVGFLGPLQRLQQPTPSSVDEDVYQIRNLRFDSSGQTLLKDYVVWDCPDMTTWAASGYLPRLLEVAGLADVLVYVASDERYNDEVPTQFLQLLLQTGKPVVVCLMKMKEEEAPKFIAHFQQEVLDRLTHDAVACLAVPFLTSEQLADPARSASAHRIPLLNQVAVLGDSPRVARERVVRGATQYLVTNQEGLLATAREELAALEIWREIVRNGQVDFDARYRREYLSGEKFHSFDDALIRLLDLLELPGVGRHVSTLLWIIRTPYRLARDFLGKAFRRPEPPSLSEEVMFQGALSAWLDMLQKEALRRADSHPLWAHIAKGLNTGLGDQAHHRLREGFRSFQLSLAGEIQNTARAIYEELEKNPVLLNTLRTSNFALDVAAIAGAFTIGHLGLHDVILVPLLASLKQQLVESLGKQYVESQREQVRARQQLLVSQYVSGPLAEWLAQWPATGGSSFERLQLVLRRIPQALTQLDSAVRQAIDDRPHASKSGA
jgi:hypothetical protein